MHLAWLVCPTTKSENDACVDMQQRDSFEEKKQNIFKGRLQTHPKHIRLAAFLKTEAQLGIIIFDFVFT